MRFFFPVPYAVLGMKSFDCDAVRMALPRAFSLSKDLKIEIEIRERETEKKKKKKRELNKCASWNSLKKDRASS